VVRFYSPEWLEQFNDAVADLDFSEEDASESGARRGHFKVAQNVLGGPDGDLLVTMRVEDGRMRLEPGSPPGLAQGAGAASDPAVTISLSYEDAAAMSKGELDPAEALG